MLIWAGVIFLLVAAVCAVLGYRVLRRPSKDLALAMFYIFMVTAVLFLLLGLLERAAARV